MRIVVDNREQEPYVFDRYGATVERGTLTTGDYSVAGLEHLVAVERKSLSDLTGTLTSGRDRFVRELERGRGLDHFAVVVEASLDDIRRHRYRSRATPHSLLQSLTAFSVRYGVHIIWAGDRSGGEYLAYHILRRYAEDKLKLLRAVGDAMSS